MRLVHNILALLAICLPEAQAAAPGPVRITVWGESGPFVLPLNQPVGAWTKIYGMGFHNAKIPASMGWAMRWTFQRVTMFATFTGQPLVATEAGITPNEGQPGLSPAEAAAIAHSLGLDRSQPDPNMPGATLWPGEHLNLRYHYVETFGHTSGQSFLESHSFLESQSFLEIWTDQFPDPSGIWPGTE